MGFDDIDPFIETPEGRAFFPYNRRAPGYLLAPADEAPLKRFLRRLRWALILMPGVFFSTRWWPGHDFIALLCLTMFYSFLYTAAVWVRCRGLPRTRTPMPRVNATRRAAAALSSDFVEVAQLVCLLFAVGGAAMFWFGVGDRWVCVATAVLFGWFWLWYCRIARIQRRERGEAIAARQIPSNGQRR